MRVIGLISGTSVDGIDAALVEITGDDLDIQVQLIANQTYPYPEALRSQILDVCAGQALNLEQMAQLDDAIATEFSQAALAIQEQTGQRAELIGSHGQTVYHRPPADDLGYTVQWGRGAAIASQTQIPTISNFRQADLAASGQGAPLVSRIDVALLSHPHKWRCVQNLGGIGNVTAIPPRSAPHWLEQVKGWDTGPGNVLLDLAIVQLTSGQQTYDPGGQWAAQGQPCFELVHQWLEHPFFAQTPPKSTGRELFSPDYLAQCWQDAQAYTLNPADWLATLTELTALSVAQSYKQFLTTQPDEVLLCGGGSYNDYLQQRLAEHLQPATVLTTNDVGLDADAKEAIAFAVLGYWRWRRNTPGNLPAVTGATAAISLGDFHPVYRA
ncbi:MAG: anhydro-N-acetylmuramic acid kinase [Spirulina sp. SIO3F2]|nr:anhydro-N-acetylmuramic acid kinase [Spirulina sp. SIO3F2]